MKRKVDASKLVAGDKAISEYTDMVLTVIGRATDGKKLVVEDEQECVFKIPVNYPLYEAPLFNLADGTKVYKGDTLYYDMYGSWKPFTVISFDIFSETVYDEKGEWLEIASLHKEIPKKKVIRYVNVYPSQLHETHEGADKALLQNHGRIACVPVEIEIEI